MPSFKIIILEQAINEIADSSSYYESQRLGLSFEFEEEVFEHLELIKNNPLLFSIKFANIHEAVLSRFPFVINYEIQGKEIIVSAVFNVKQNPDKKIKRKRK